MGPFIQSSPIARYLKVIYTKNPGVLPRVQYHVNHDGRISPQDNLFEYPRFHFGDVGRRDCGFDVLKRYQAALEQLPGCTRCPVEYYCPRGDYANLAQGGMGQASRGNEFLVCDEIRDNIYYLMTLGDRGIRLVESIFGETNE